MEIIWSFWSQPKIFLLIGTVCFVLFALLRFSRTGTPYRYERYEYRSRRPNGSWRLVEQIAAIMGIVSFIIQVAVWVYPWL